ncbi:MAG: hypothetical protein ACE5EF_06655 [Dehalococcoidia bacterium]
MSEPSRKGRHNRLPMRHIGSMDIVRVAVLTALPVAALLIWLREVMP